ncbi:MAG: AI-2E family transporter [Pseudomonadota bacterium]
MTVTLGLILAVGAFALLHIGRDILVPMALAVLLWFLIGAIAQALMAWPVVRPFLTLARAKAVAVMLILGLIVATAKIIAQSLPAITTGLNPENGALLGRLLSYAPALGLPADLSLDWVTTFYPYEELLSASVGLVRDLVSSASLVALYVMFLLLDERYFDMKLRALVRDDTRRAGLEATLGQVSRQAQVYLRLMFFISAGVGIATFAVCWAFGLKGAAFWGFIAFILNFIPTLGSIMAVVLPVTYALLTLTDPVALIAVIALLSATQFVAGEIVLPRVMGDNLNLSSVVVLFTLVFWGVLWGPVGMFLGIPITVIAMVVCARFDSLRGVAIFLSKDGRIPSR